jgi:hypothetical protein
MAIRDKNTLKTFFETGDIPSQNQFADLIDSLKHQNDTAVLVLTDQVIVSFANRLETIENPSVQYSLVNMGDSLIKLDIAQENGENQTIEIRSNIYEMYFSGKQYLLGGGPFTVTIKELKSEELRTNEYYHLNLGGQNGSMQRLIGNRLPTTLKDFKFDTIKGRGFTFFFSISKQNFGRELGIVHTNIEFVNKTDVPIEYRCYSYYWSDLYTTKDTITSHYDEWDYLSFECNADMTKEDYTIEFNVYDRDTKELLSSNYLNPGENYKGIGMGGVNGVRNVMIECTKQ